MLFVLFALHVEEIILRLNAIDIYMQKFFLPIHQRRLYFMIGQHAPLVNLCALSVPNALGDVE